MEQSVAKCKQPEAECTSGDDKLNSKNVEGNIKERDSFGGLVPI
jgi:hypothetical protein